MNGVQECGPRPVSRGFGVTKPNNQKPCAAVRLDRAAVLDDQCSPQIARQGRRPRQDFSDHIIVELQRVTEGWTECKPLCPRLSPRGPQPPPIESSVAR